MEGVEAFLFFLALRGEAKREEVRARFPRLVPLLKALGEAVEVQGETFRLAKPLRLSWFAPSSGPGTPPPPRGGAGPRLGAARGGRLPLGGGGEPLVDGEGLLKAARLFQAGSQALLKGDHREALHRLGEALGLLEKEGLPFPAAALALLAQAQEGFRPGGKGKATARKALRRAQTPFVREVAERILSPATDPEAPGP